MRYLGYLPAVLAGLALGVALARRRGTGRLAAELHDRREFTDALLQSMNEAVMVLDANHRVIDVNRRWFELTGQDAERGSRPESLPPPGTGDWTVRHVNGAQVPVLATLSPIPDADGEPRAYVATYVDIADRKRAEEALSAHNSELRAALAFKNDLTSMLTHDVAQPISSIASLAELLSADWDDLPDDVRRELATKIDRNTRRLIKMMNDLQLLFRLDTGAVTARRTPVRVLEVVESVAATAPDGTVEILVDDEVSALADRAHLVAVVQNLLANALAYGAPPIELGAVQTADSVVLTVRDSGPGIPEELLPKLFDRVLRGAGLGLFIVRHLVEANGGSVRYEPAEPCGARLVVTWESASPSA